MMAQMIMKNRKQTVNTGKMFKWDICEKVMRYVPNLKESFIFYMSTINLESDRTLDFLNKHMQICLLKMVWKIQFRNNTSVLKIY